MRFNRLSLTSKLFLLLLPLALVPLLAILSYWHFVTKKQITNELRLRLEGRWTTVEEEMRRFFSQKRARVREVAGSPLFKDLFGNLEYGLREEAENTRAKIREYFLQLSDDQQAIHRICFTLRAGMSQIKTVREGQGSTGQQIPGMKCLPVFSDTVMPTSLKDPDGELKSRFVRFTEPLIDRWGEIWAFLSFDVPLFELSRLLEKLPLPGGGASLIFEAHGDSIACAEEPGQIPPGEICSKVDIIKNWGRAISAKNSVEPHGETIDGFVMFAGGLPIKNLTWRAALVVPLDRYDKNIRQLGWNSFIAGLLFFSAAVIVLMPLSRRATAPLRRLEELTRTIAEGDFQQRLPITSGDEIGRLANAFNAMADSLANRDTRLRQQAESLTARNEELATLNRIIDQASMSLKIETLLPSLLDEILSVMNLKVGAIRLVDPIEKVLRLVANRGLSTAYEKMPETIHIGEELTGRVAQTGRPVFIEDVNADPAAAKLLERVQAGQPLRCFAAVPIVANEKIIGVLALGATGDRTFHQTDLSSLVSIGLGIGACIENARLYEDLETAYERLKALQENLIQAEKLSALGQLVAGVAHEINNPLTTILGYAQLIQSNPENLNHQEEVETIIDQTRRCAKVVENLLAFARKSGKHQEQLNLAEVVRDVLDAAKMSLSLHNIEITYTAQKDECFILGDRYQLQQVFLNVITNAQHALEDHPLPRSLEVVITSSGDNYTVSVIDNGEGIPPEVARKIFDPFFTTKPVGKGTGLGLSLSYGIIKDHGGDITIESQSGSGTTANIIFPRLTEKRHQKSEKPKQGASWKHLAGRRILVVDDEKTICEFLKASLSPVGMDITIAHSLKDAMEILRDTSPDIILTDVRLRDGDGFHLYDEVKASGNVRPGHFAFMSGDIVSEQTLEKLQNSKCPHIQKPFGIEDVRQFLSNRLGNTSEDQTEKGQPAQKKG